MSKPSSKLVCMSYVQNIKMLESFLSLYTCIQCAKNNLFQDNYNTTLENYSFNHCVLFKNTCSYNMNLETGGASYGWLADHNHNYIVNMYIYLNFVVLCNF